ncbi:tyrosine-type recombinase/integrase [Corynebacterium choanae]|uniref:Phage integrase family protein n=1 Tax=Corynebacterium choanae TaxID=1862358 RepID=A0A3G6J8E4_9CORY|nr:tyrosine-type recombinase/integrase [Corynebacterium choanae]AZA14043.1 Phage integrase family protein [Corynebacterium choanae]
MVAEHSGDHATLVWLLGTVGLRWGEAAGLQVGDIDHDRGRITIARSVSWLQSELVLGTPINGKPRQVSVTMSVLRMLAQQTAGKPKTAWVFFSSDGMPLRKQNAGSGFFARGYPLPAARS